MATEFENLIDGFPDLPFFVVTKITPAAACSPYTAAEEASFKMVIVSISSGSNCSNERLTPSTITTGLFEDAKLLGPRIVIDEASPPGKPLDCLDTNPGNLPVIIPVILPIGDCIISVELI
ncbi:hypothetical protein D3C87_1493990 [compost metagenome]